MAVDIAQEHLTALSQSLYAIITDLGKNTKAETNGVAEEEKSEEATTNGVTEEKKAETNGETNGEKKDESSTEEEKPVVEPGSIGSAHNLYQVKDKDSGDMIWTSDYPKDIPEAAENEETAKYAVVAKYVKSNDTRKKLEAATLIIQSSLLKKALSEILKDYPGISCELLRLEFQSPFEPFMHRWTELLEYLAREDLDKAMKEHLTVLVDILKEEMRDSIKAFENYISKGITTFDHAWMIFQPGCLVVSAGRGPLSVLELVEAEYVVCQGQKSLRLQCEAIDWGGSEFGRLTQYISIPAFKGTEKITSLTGYPFAFHPDAKSATSLLVERGKKFESLAGHHFRYYKGIAITWDDEGRERGVYHDGRVVIDCKSFNNHSSYSSRWLNDFESKDIPHLARKAKTTREYDPLNEVVEEEEGSKYILDDYLRLLCYSRVRGYSLSKKKWFDFYVQLVSDISWDSRAFDSLVLPEDQKELILSFTESQVEHRKGFDDVVTGKGQGIIILLSGKPGIGKTLTAESVAESMRRPLHTISSGDLGSSAWDIERSLTSVLDLVGRWNAVLLLDECDVFLEARSNHDLDRNAMVSTFLRVLEYYNGILFMTTNRADNIDPAFESRIHVSMQYPDLTVESRKKIWKNFLSTQDHALSGADMDELAEIDLNGRQIKNILKTSHLLASRKRQKLSMKDIGTVLDIENRRPERHNRA